ncbi:MAG: hypothetical protein ABIP50_01695 [Candidatus Saccharimonadales bacterium]
MRLVARLFVVIIMSFIVVGVGLALQRQVSAVAPPYNCTADGKFASPSQGSALLTIGDQAKISSASAWIKSMTHTRTSTVTDSTITPDSDYAPSYQGLTSGTFHLDGRSFSTNASISVSSPATVTDAYRGVISGQVLETPSSFRWIIQAYKRENGVISQVPVQALADGTTGNFSIDLSSVDPSTNGEWMLGLLDANAGYAPYGSKWPDAEYVGLEVQQYVITDTLYYWATTAAMANGTFTFQNSNTGSKLFRLVDTTTNPDDILAEYVKPTGLVRSYAYQSGETGYGTAVEDRSFAYDQAMALFAAISVGDSTLAKQLVGGLLNLQTQAGPHAGGFVFAAPQLSPTYTDMLYRIGAHAIATDALLAYIETYPNDADIASYKIDAENALSFMQTTFSSTGQTSGLYLGGYGLYSGNPQTFDDSYVIDWASTEHNIDAWHALMRASRVLGNTVTDYRSMADQLDAAVSQKLYNTTEQRFNQGVDAGGQDVSDPLDVNSWGSIQLYASGKPERAETSLARLSLFENTRSGITGYGAFYDAGGYPGAAPTIWFEGSFGAALAYYKNGDYTAYRTLIDQLIPAQENDGSFRYATDPDTTYDIGTSKSVASTAWYVVATAGRNILWNTCVYTPPVVPSNPTPVVTSPSDNSSHGTNKNSQITQEDLGHSFVPETVKNTPIESSNPEQPSSTATEQNDNKDSATIPWIIIAGVSGLVVVGVGVTIGIIRRRL